MIQKLSNCWKSGNFYQTYPRGFYDTNNDSISSTSGIIKKISYLKNLGADAQMSKMLCALLLDLRESAISYQEEGLRLNEATFSLHNLKNPYGISFYPAFKDQDECRVPLSYKKNKPFAEFNKDLNQETWLPTPQEHLDFSIDVQETLKNSVLQLYKKLCHFYKSAPPLHLGSITNIQAKKNILSFIHTCKNDYRFFFFNCGFKTESVKLLPQDIVPCMMESAHLNKKTYILTLEPCGFFIGSKKLSYK